MNKREFLKTSFKTAAAAFLATTLPACASEKKMAGNILFINGSANKGGNTAKLAEILLKDKSFESLYLTDLSVAFYGQKRESDDFPMILEKIKNTDTLILGSPVYWHNICASMRCLMERFYGVVATNAFAGKRLFFIYQGMAPTRAMIESGESTMKRFASLYGFAFEGMANNATDAAKLAQKV